MLPTPSSKEFYSALPISTVAREVSALVIRGILLEVATTPKPGLVDRTNSGAHSDMTFETFMASSAALAPHFPSFVQLGLDWAPCEAPLSKLLPSIRRIGIVAERAMFAATHGVNTQKGLLFTAGLIATAAGLHLGRKLPLEVTEIGRSVGEITHGIVVRELAPLTPTTAQTAGQRWYLRAGRTGVRGEVEAGLPSVIRGVTALRSALARGTDLEEALIHALFILMTVVDDTTILNRHDEVTLAEVQRDAQDFLARGSIFAADGLDRVRRMDTAYSARGISPGGSADLLAVTAACYFLERMPET